jgi:predicted Fe-S protein YdhL (DUF1289 family)
VTIESPCVKLCFLENNVCISCNRTREQISSWTKLTSEQRREIMDSLAVKRNDKKDVDPSK